MRYAVSVKSFADVFFFLVNRGKHLFNDKHTYFELSAHNRVLILL